MRNHTIRYQKPAVFFLLFAMLIQFTGLFPVSVQAADDKVVRVGYFAFEGYHNQDEEGNKSGYGYEYLQQMARYTGWTYEYTGYDGSWNDAQEMLENGEIDLLTSAQKTEAREAVFDFSAEPIGYSSTIFTIKAGNEKYTIDNFSTFEGIRVGMINGNSRNDGFARFAGEKGFAYEPVMFESTTDLVNALHDESIDAIVTSSLRVTDGEWIVAEFDTSPYVGRPGVSTAHTSGSSVLSKSGTYDPATHTILWTVTVNSNSIAMQDIQLTDYISATGQNYTDQTRPINQTYVSDSLQAVTAGYTVTKEAVEAGDDSNMVRFSVKKTGDESDAITVPVSFTFRTVLTDS